MLILFQNLGLIPQNDLLLQIEKYFTQEQIVFHSLLRGQQIFRQFFYLLNPMTKHPLSALIRIDIPNYSERHKSFPVYSKRKRGIINVLDYISNARS